jgi:hypothetical protein
MKKNPILAAVLNFFLFGGGTVYVGKRVGVGLVMTVGGTVAQIAEILISPPVYDLAPTIWPFLLGGLVVLKLGLAMDAYTEAKSVG